MKEVKPIWVISKTVKVGGEITHTAQVSYEKLYDALNHIGVWSNMKTQQNFVIDVLSTDESNMSEVCFSALKGESRWSAESEEEIIRLRKTDLFMDKKEDPA